MTLHFPEIFPVLRTEYLQLREITDADAEDLFLLRDDERVRRYFDIEPLKKVEEERERIKTISENFTNIKEAHFREDYFFRGKFLDTAVYSLLNKK